MRVLDAEIRSNSAGKYARALVNETDVAQQVAQVRGELSRAVEKVSQGVHAPS